MSPEKGTSSNLTCKYLQSGQQHLSDWHGLTISKQHYAVVAPGMQSNAMMEQQHVKAKDKAKDNDNGNDNDSDMDRPLVEYENKSCNDAAKVCAALMPYLLSSSVSKPKVTMPMAPFILCRPGLG